MKNKKNYDKRYFTERDHLQTHLLNVIELLLKKHKAKRVLEVGVGTGQLMKELRKDGYKVDGIDASPIAAKMAGVKVGTATKIPFKDSTYDCVIAISLIEHINKEEGVIFAREINRVLKKGGLVFLVTPNYASPLRYIHGKNWAGFVDKTHVFFYSPMSLKRLLESQGFSKTTWFFDITTTNLEWPLPAFLYKSPPFIRLWINYLFAKTPMALCRDSFWISGVKKKNV